MCPFGKLSTEIERATGNTSIMTGFRLALRVYGGLRFELIGDLFQSFTRITKKSLKVWYEPGKIGFFE